MCDFLSVLINKDCDKELKIYVGDLRSHSETVKQHGLKPGDYREVEWTGENENTLVVRTEPEDHPKNWYRSIILASWPDRSSFLDYCLKFANGDCAYLRGCTGLKSLPDGFNPKEYVDLQGCTGLKSLPDGFNPKGYADLQGCTGLNKEEVSKKLKCRIYW